MTLRIPLSRGLFAYIDDVDEVAVGHLRWNARPCKRTWYAARTIWIPAEQRFTTQRMHSILTGWTQVDHMNGNGLDNRRCNLREVSNAENQRNRRKGSGTSAFKGVSRNNGKGKDWHAQLRLDGKTLNLGLFDDERAAAYAYDAAARRHFGEYAALNFPEEGERSALREALTPELVESDIRTLSRPPRKNGVQPKWRSRSTSSQFKGVYRDRKTTRWVVQFGRRHVGIYDDEVEAARAYDAVARRELGPHALLNFPGPGERSALPSGATTQSLHVAALFVSALLVVSF